MKPTWLYSSHRLIPNCGPHERVDEEYINSGKAWSDYPYAVCATYATSFDKPTGKDYYYVIKDTPLDISKLKAKRRYEITKGCRNFDFAVSDTPADLADELYKCYLESLTGYVGERVTVQSKQSFLAWLQSVDSKRGGVIYVVRNKTSKEIAGWAHVLIYDDWAAFSVMKTIPRYERDGVNAALVYGILEHLQPKFEKENFYFSDGSRTLFHKTAFQDYLEKYFQFRKAYCRLNIVYNPRFGWLVKMLYPFRNLLKRFTAIMAVRGLLAVLKLEEIRRNNK